MTINAERSYTEYNVEVPTTDFPLGFDGDTALREQRLRHLLEGREVHTRDSFIDTQLDVVSPSARALLPLIGADLWFTGEPAAPGTPERQRQEALRLLAEWDGAMSEHLPEPRLPSCRCGNGPSPASHRPPRPRPAVRATRQAVRARR